jgi:hypothetical protein
MVGKWKDIPPRPGYTARQELSQIDLLSNILAEQQKTNELLAALVDALAEDGGEPDAEPVRYMDGTPVRG